MRYETVGAVEVSFTVIPETAVLVNSNGAVNRVLRGHGLGPGIRDPELKTLAEAPVH